MNHQKAAEQATYSARVIEEAANPKHMRRMPDPDAVGIIHGCCGDTMEIYLRLDKDKIKEATFMTDGHESAIAGANRLAAMIQELTLEEASRISAEEVIDALGGLPQAKVHCAQLAINTLREAIANGQKGAQ